MILLEEVTLCQTPLGVNGLGWGEGNLEILWQLPWGKIYKSLKQMQVEQRNGNL